MKRLPFRARLTVWSTMVAAASIIMCGAGAAWFVYQRECSELDAGLRADSDHFFSELQRHGAAKFDWRKIDGEMREWISQRSVNQFMEVRTGESVRWRSKDLAAPGFEKEPLGLRDVKVGGKWVRLLASEQDGVTFVIAVESSEARATAEGVAIALLAGFPLALAFAWLGARRIATLAVAPVGEMTHAMERVSAEQLDRRVPVPAVNDEIQRHARVLNETLDRLELSYKQALRFSGDASHELKTPLSVLRASIEAVLESPTLSETDRPAISTLLEQTRRLTDITSSLLLLSRADAGRLTLDLGRHDLAALAGACAEDAGIIAEQHGIQMEVDLPETAPAMIDPLRFSQIVSNLLDNAVKYNEPGGLVRVALTDAGAAWRLTVGNSGSGIPEGDRPKLFERFYRVEHTAEIPGHGLGLGLARELARAHGGDVTLVRCDDGWIEFAALIPKRTNQEPMGAVRDERLIVETCSTP